MEQIIRESDFYLPAGCPACNGAGYSGKMAMIEMVPFTPGVGNIIVSGMDIEEKMSLIISEDFYPAVESVYDLLRRGMITYDDILPFL
jgi:type II secretory ATPase GspE/PulE/Tfp pilus assembly ATPase PilB-like protein